MLKLEFTVERQVGWPRLLSAVADSDGLFAVYMIHCNFRRTLSLSEAGYAPTKRFTSSLFVIKLICTA